MFCQVDEEIEGDAVAEEQQNDPCQKEAVLRIVLHKSGKRGISLAKRFGFLLLRHKPI